MASFLQPSADPFGQMQLYQPDWSFLTQVMGHKQAEYDRGFNMVQSVYSSILNSPLSNPNNEEFRQDAFNKLQKSLRSVSALDLSNPGNIQKAMKLIEPLAKDQDLAYDIMWTKESKKELEKLSYHKTHLDPEVRKLYNPYAEQYMQLGQEKLQSAKRGDGSIRQVKPLEFIPFFDMNEFLDKRAKANGLKITRSETNGGYIIERVNGKGTAPEFHSWASLQIGDQFDRQIGVMAEVTAETSIKSQMEQGMSREDAINSLVGEFVDASIKQETVKLNHITQYLQKVETQIARLPKDMTPQHVEQHHMLLEQKELLNQSKINITDNIEALSSNEEFVFDNLYGIIANTLKESSVQNWALAHATTTESVTLKPDQVVLTQMRMSQAERFHNQNLAYKYFALFHEKQKETTGTTSDATSRTKTYANGTTLQVTSQSTPQGEVSGVQAYHNAYQKTENEILNLIPSLSGMFFDNAFQYQPAISRLAKGIITNEDYEILSEAAEKIGYTNMSMPENEIQARAIALQFGAHLHNVVSDLEGNSIEETEILDKITKNFYNLYNAQIEASKNLADISESVFKYQEETKNKIRGSKKRFQDADIIGYSYDGRPIANLSDLNPEHLNEIYSDSRIQHSDFIDNISVTNSYTITNIDNDILTFITSPQLEKGLDKKVRKQVDEYLRGRNLELLKKQMNDNMNIEVDNISEQLKLDIRLDLGKGVTENIIVPVGFNDVLFTQQGVLEPLKDVIKANSDTRTIYKHPYNSVLENKTIEAPTAHKRAGFDWNLYLDNNNQLTIGYNMKNVEDDGKDMYYKIQISNNELTDDWNANFEYVEHIINEQLKSYQSVVQQYNANVTANSSTISKTESEKNFNNSRQ